MVLASSMLKCPPQIPGIFTVNSIPTKYRSKHDILATFNLSLTNPNFLLKAGFRPFGDFEIPLR